MSDIRLMMTNTLDELDRATLRWTKFLQRISYLAFLIWLSRSRSAQSILPRIIRSGDFVFFSSLWGRTVATVLVAERSFSLFFVQNVQWFPDNMILGPIDWRTSDDILRPRDIVESVTVRMLGCLCI